MPLLQIVGALAAIALVAVLANSRTEAMQNVKSVAAMVLMLIVVGITLWLINTFVPMAESIKTILNIVVVVATCVGVLRAAGLWQELTGAWDRFTHRVSH